MAQKRMAKAVQEAAEAKANEAIRRKAGKVRVPQSSHYAFPDPKYTERRISDKPRKTLRSSNYRRRWSRKSEVRSAFQALGALFLHFG